MTNSEKRQNTFGGLIYLSDFTAEYGGTRHIASRILSDWEFDRQCRKNGTNRTNYNGGK
ncbi:MAG: hypothetical protein HFG80_10055 [Eubacterium sp.]|nr:hypothetical protein [Eubacterium sp.]